MRNKVIIITLLTFVCCSPKVLPPVQHDSVRVEIREHLVRDTVTVEVPVVIERVVTRDTVSVLSNDWAESEASVHDGLLTHSLATRPRVIHVPVTRTVRDTVTIEKEAVIIREEVPAELTRSQRNLIRMGKAFSWLIALAAAAASVAVLLKVQGLTPAKVVQNVWKMLKK